jgi:hypothetical protein
MIGRALFVFAAAALNVSAPAAAAQFATVTPPDTDAFVTDCTRGRSVQTCVCMAQFLQRSGEGQFVLETAILDAGDTPGLDKTIILARHGIAPGDARAITRAGKAVRKLALGACR